MWGVVRDGLPEFGRDGAVVGGHDTMVEAVRMHTHGLGGDSEVTMAGDDHDGLRIGPRRVAPLVSAAGGDRDRIEAALRRQLDVGNGVGRSAPVFVAPGRRTAVGLDRKEREVLDRVDGLVAAEEVVRGSLDRRALHRLLGRGVVWATGFTPTDACHVLGIQDTHDPTLARLGARVWARRLDHRGNPVADSPEAFASKVVALVVRRSSEVVLGAAFERDGIAPGAAHDPIIQAALDRRLRTARLDAGLAVPLVGLGAPAHAFYPAVGELLGADLVVPEHADVANAIGAAVAKVRVRRQVVVTGPRRGTYRVHGGPDPETVHDLDEARQRATAHAEEWVRAEMAAAGAQHVAIDTSWEETSVEVEGRPMFVEGVVTVRGAGPPRLDRQG